MGYVILLWHSLSLPYNYSYVLFAIDEYQNNNILMFNHWKKDFGLGSIKNQARLVQGNQ